MTLEISTDANRLDKDLIYLLRLLDKPKAMECDGSRVGFSRLSPESPPNV